MICPLFTGCRSRRIDISDELPATLAGSGAEMRIVADGSRIIDSTAFDKIKTEYYIPPEMIFGPVNVITAADGDGLSYRYTTVVPEGTGVSVYIKYDESIEGKTISELSAGEELAELPKYDNYSAYGNISGSYTISDHYGCKAIVIMSEGKPEQIRFVSCGLYVCISNLGENVVSLFGFEYDFGLEYALRSLRNHAAVMSNNFEETLKHARDTEGCMEKTIATVHYYTRSSWVPVVNEKMVDLVNLTYSTNKSVDHIEAYPAMAESGEYTRGWQEVSKFSRENAVNYAMQLKVHGIFGLGPRYWIDAADGTGWYLIITFTDGSEFRCSGYYRHPDGAECFNEDTIRLTGYPLFDIYNN
jgi:hypothetical protein